MLTLSGFYGKSKGPILEWGARADPKRFAWYSRTRDAIKSGNAYLVSFKEGCALAAAPRKFRRRLTGEPSADLGGVGSLSLWHGANF